MEKIKIEELKKMHEDVKIMLDALGIEYGNITKLWINPRSKSRLGQCSKKGNFYEIQISEYATVDKEKTFNTLMHETLHTVEGCMNHGSKWQKLANIVNKKYGLTVATISKISEDQKQERMKSVKYIIKCKKCGNEGGYMKKSKVVSNVDRYRCKCGGSLELIAN